MAVNIQGAAGVPLTVFGGWVPEMAPAALPEGVSPDCQDVAFVPGSVFSRPCLKKVFATAFPSGGPNTLVPSVVYGKSFVTPAGAIKNLYLDSNGVMWVEDLTNSPGTYTQLFKTTPGSYCKSVTAFGREYIAISDGLHGQEVPLQYDGSKVERVTSDAPGAPPQISMISYPSVSLTTLSPASITVSTITPTGYNTTGGFYSLISVVTATPHGFTEGEPVKLAGTTATEYNGYFASVHIFDSVTFSMPFFQYTNTTATGGTATPQQPLLIRANNTVTAQTSAAHNLQVGYQVQIAGVAASSIGTGVNSIVINNEDLPGLATVTTSTAHGLAPGNYVTLTGINPTAVGGGISSIVRSGGTVTLTTASAHGILPGVNIQIAGVTDTTFDGSFTVPIVPSPTQIVYYQNAADATSSGGTVSVPWPIPTNTLTPTYFQVVTAPTSTTFTVQVTYADGTWGPGGVYFPWDGIFYVTAVPSSTSFQYQQYGPNATQATVSGSETARPYGQMAPGIHLCQVMFQNDQGGITAPSPPAVFTAPGGQYPVLNDIPIGPTGTTKRIVQFTGAQPNVPGNLPPFFYIPTAAQTQGQIVSTSTVIDDNTTSTVVMDFSDNTLFASIGTSIPGNTLANQIKLDGAVAFGYYQSRLMTWGQRATIQNLLNTGFDGGYISTATTLPLGWTYSSALGGSGSLAAGHYGSGWLASISSPGTGTGRAQLVQGFYQDAYGAPIASPNVTYKVRMWLKPSLADSNLTGIFFIRSLSTGFSATATVGGSQFVANPYAVTNGGWFEATFSAATPATIPTDFQWGFYTVSKNNVASILYDEISIFDANAPYLDTEVQCSYVNNPEGMDGVSGVFQPTEDTHKIMDMGILRETLYILTQDPSGRLHETGGSQISEPSGWAINEVAANCGILSSFALTLSQADDQTGAGGDDWMAWPGEGGVLIFGGGQPQKISQELQPAWSGVQPQGMAWAQVNLTLGKTVQALNDPVEKVVYFFLPMGTNAAPSLMYVLNYRELNTSYAIANSPPFHPSLSGRLVATDNTRKWTRWNLSLSGAARMYREAGKLTSVFFSGNGFTPDTAASYGNVYTLSSAYLTDDDYGKIYPYYMTYFHLDPEKAQAVGLKGGLIELCYVMAYVTGTGTMTVSTIVNQITNVWPLSFSRTMSTSPPRDMEGGGGQAQANRIALKFASSPITGFDNGFTLQRLTLWFRDARPKIGGAAA